MGEKRVASKGMKTGGRQAGTPNRKTRELSDRIQELLGGQDLPGVIFSKIKKLSPERQAEFLMELMPYVYPRRKATELKAEVTGMTFSDFVKAAAHTESK